MVSTECVLTTTTKQASVTTPCVCSSHEGVFFLPIRHPAHPVSLLIFSWRNTHSVVTNYKREIAQQQCTRNKQQAMQRPKCCIRKEKVLKPCINTPAQPGDYNRVMLVSIMHGNPASYSPSVGRILASLIMDV